MEKISSSSVNSKCIQDSIDCLPDEVIISIVSRLPLVEAGRTSVLARRWRYFWMFTSILNFDALRVLFKFDYQRTSPGIGRRKFVRWVNSVLNLHCGATLQEFRISFDLDQSSADDIDKWLQFAFSKRVNRLELNLVDSNKFLFSGNYNFPNMCDSIECLRILPLGISSCESLVTLSLYGVNVTEETLKFFISNCPFLEELCVRYSRHLKKLKTSSPLIRLRRLEIASCGSFKSLEISAPNLRSLSLYGIHRTPMFLKNVPPLTSVFFGAAFPEILIENMHQISGCLSELETLMLHTTITDKRVLRKSPDLVRLRKLVLDICTHGCGSILCFTPLMDAAPLLRELVLRLKWSQNLTQRTIHPPAKGHRLHCLEVLQLEGFAGAAIDIELAQYVIENAPKLKRMVIDFRRLEPDIMLKFEKAMARAGEAKPMNDTEMAMALEGVRLLKDQISPGVELFIR